MERVWGGDRLARVFSRPLPPGPIGESWEVYGELPVRSAPWDGKTLDELTRELGTELIGTASRADRGFPLLTKWLDCNDWLSVQVHPDDRLARELTGSPAARGKSECWYFLQVDPQGEVLHGLADGVQVVPDLSLADGREMVERLHREHPRPGTFRYTPAGTIHALGPGLLLYEIQQSCDITYRLYDWDRVGLDGKPRQLHRPEALRAAAESHVPPGPTEVPNRLGSLEVSSPYFVVESVQGPADWMVDPSSFEIVTVLDRARLSTPRGEVILEPGDSAVLPANSLQARLELAQGDQWLRTRVPSLGRESSPATES